MKRKRYLIVDHPVELDTIDLEKGVPRIAVHHLLESYHWSRLDDKTIIVKAEYPAVHHTELEAHLAVTMLPSESSGKSVINHIEATGPDHHVMAIRQHSMGVAEHHTMGDFVDSLEKTLGSIFALDR